MKWDGAVRRASPQSDRVIVMSSDAEAVATAGSRSQSSRSTQYPSHTTTVRVARIPCPIVARFCIQPMPPRSSKAKSVAVAGGCAAPFTSGA